MWVKGQSKAYPIGRWAHVNVKLHFFFKRRWTCWMTPYSHEILLSDNQVICKGHRAKVKVANQDLTKIETGPKVHWQKILSIELFDLQSADFVWW